jgi:hypothetical protein
MTAIILAFVLSSTAPVPLSGGEALLSKDASAKELVESCRRMIPGDVELSGRMILRSRKGIVKAKYGYRLKRRGGETTLEITDADGRKVDFSKEGRILETDVTWSDLSLDYLWWDEYSFDGERDGESVHGQVCAVVVMKKGDRTVRVWIDRKTGALMQAEEFSGDKRLRRLWGTRIKKFGERWMANVLEVESAGSANRTKITVEEMK